MRLFALAVICLFITGPAYAVEPLRLLTHIPLSGVSGRIDHMAIDKKSHRLFIAALGNNSLEVVDLEKATRIKSIPGLSEPQGVIYTGVNDRLIVANGGDGTCAVFDAGTFKRIHTLNLFQDADNLRYDVYSQRLYAAYGRGAIAIFDSGFNRIGNIHLPGHPESFALSDNDARIFVNIPAIQSVAVVDTAKQRLTASWRLPRSRGNYPMALDQENHLLLIGARYPARLIGLNTQTGRVAFSIAIDGDADDIFIDKNRHRIYVSCGAGYLDVLEQNNSGTYKLLKKIPTSPGARTSLFDPDSHRLYLAVPRNGRQQAEIWVFSS